MQAEQDKRKAAQREAHQQDLAGADMIGEVAHRRLGQAGDDGKDRQREAELDIADAELLLQEREQHRQHQQMEMADPMGGRNQDKRPQRGVGFSSRLRLLRCSQNVDHIRPKPRSNPMARQGPPKLSSAGYLSMNTAAWQPSPRAAERGGPPLNRETKRPGAGMIRYGRFRAYCKTAAGACFRGKQHFRAG